MILKTDKDFADAVKAGKKIKSLTTYYTGQAPLLEAVKKQPITIGAYDAERDAIYCGNLRGKDIWVKTNTNLDLMTWQQGIEYASKVGGYLPSIDELTRLYLNKDVVNKAIKEHGGMEIKNDWYWSSSEFSSFGSWRLSMGSGNRGGSHKTNGNYVRVFQL